LIDGTGTIIGSQDEVGGYPEYDSNSRTIVDIPATENERRAWLDSISTSLEAAVDLDVLPLYKFMDENLSTVIHETKSFLWQCYPNPVSDHINLTFRLYNREAIHFYLVDGS
jgi:hypothetical protein